MSKILVVEDESAIAESLRIDLEIEGYDVTVVSDGVAAARELLEGGYDVALLDVMLPGKSGFDVCREARAAGVDTRVIMLTAKAEEAERVLGLELGADDYVTKPFSAAELRARIKAHLRRYAGGVPSRLRFGPYELDLDRIELIKDGAAVPLTPLEFRLLGALARNAGRTLSRQRILDLVWGEATYVTDRVIDNHVLNLRKKIEDDPAAPRYVISVRGVGYRFEA